MIIVFSIPFCKASQSFTQTCVWLETKVLLQRCCICISNGHVTWLHGYKFLVCLEVIVFRKHSCMYKFFLEDGNEVKEVFRRVVADVVYLEY